MAYFELAIAAAKKAVGFRWSILRACAGVRRQLPDNPEALIDKPRGISNVAIGTCIKVLDLQWLGTIANIP